jgi:MFS family permease
VRERSTYRDLLAVRDLRALIGAGTASQFGEWLFNAVLLAYVYSATGSAAWLGAAAIGRLLPYLLLGPMGQAIAHRYPPRTVLLAGDLMRLLLMLALAALVAADGAIALVIALSFLASVAGCAERPAAMALLPRLAGESLLGPANALLQRLRNLGAVLGPGIGAILLAVASDSLAFLASGAIFTVSALAVATIRPGGAPAGAPPGSFALIAEGLRNAAETRFAVPLLVLVGMAQLTYGAQTVQLVVYAERSLDLGDAGYAVLLTALGVGGALSAIGTGRLTSSTRVVLVVVTTGALICVTQFVYAGSELLAIALAAAVVGGAALVACEVVAGTTLSRVVPSDALGWVVGLFDASSVLARLTGALLASILIASTSLRTSLLVLGAVPLLVSIACIRALRGLDALSARRSEALASRLAAIEYLPVTAGVPRLVLERLASAAQTCPLPPGVDVVVQGAPAHAFYAVVDGRVVVHRDHEAVVHLGPGDSFGERGLLDNAPRNATVTTEMDTTVVRIEGHALLDALQAAPTLGPALDQSSSAPGVQVPDQRRPSVDDPDWVGA